MLVGTKRRVVTVAEGEFQCPQCHKHTTYTRKRDMQYVTVVFVPVKPTNDMVVDYVECNSCKRQFHTSHNMALH
jgi:transcription elongation factor Elf1